LAEDFKSKWPNSAPELNPQTVLGVSTTHETSACVVRNGKILAAVSEERISRVKVDASFPPVGAIREVIRAANIDPKEIDAIAIAGLSPRHLFSQSLESQKRDFLEYHSWNDYFPHFCKILYRLYYFARSLKYKDVLALLYDDYGITPKVFYVEHHEAAGTRFETENNENINNTNEKRVIFFTNSSSSN
jgi:predicted NodU family carbamoyl transferase